MPAHRTIIHEAGEVWNAAGVVYAATKGIFSNLIQLAQTHPAANGILLKAALTGMPLSLHPGAERYYREIGLLR